VALVGRDRGSQERQSVRLIAIVAMPGDTLVIGGTPVASGAPSAELTLSPGDNPVDIVVENAQGWRRTYRLTLRRAAESAQYAYDKASSTGATDPLGNGVALSGDTLAVGDDSEDAGAGG
jgi:trimeric autotransporter adhesin